VVLDLAQIYFGGVRHSWVASEVLQSISWNSRVDLTGNVGTSFLAKNINCATIDINNTCVAPPPYRYVTAKYR
jgi:hypothetical protein